MYYDSHCPVNLRMALFLMPKSKHLESYLLGFFPVAIATTQYDYHFLLLISFQNSDFILIYGPVMQCHFDKFTSRNKNLADLYSLTRKIYSLNFWGI